VVLPGVQISPRRRDERTCSIGQDEEKMQAARAMGPAQDIQRLTFQRVPSADDRYFGRIVLEVGSVSWFPSIESTTTCLWRGWPDE